MAGDEQEPRETGDDESEDENEGTFVKPGEEAQRPIELEWAEPGVKRGQ